MTVKHPRLLASIFSAPFIRGLTSRRRLGPLRKILRAVGLNAIIETGFTIAQVFDAAYAALRKWYRCEYVFKNELVRQRDELADVISSGEVLAVHGNLPVADRWTDVVMVNGTTQVFEVKSRYDSLRRLDGQIAAFRKAFDRIFVMTCERRVDRVKESVAPTVGVIALTGEEEDFRLVPHRPATSNKANICSQQVYYLLRKAECHATIERHWPEIPDVPDVYLTEHIRDFILDLDSEDAHDELVKSLTARRVRDGVSDLAQAPESLMFHAHLGNLKAQQLHVLSGGASSLVH